MKIIIFILLIIPASLSSQPKYIPGQVELLDGSFTGINIKFPLGAHDKHVRIKAVENGKTVKIKTEEIKHIYIGENNTNPTFVVSKHIFLANSKIKTTRNKSVLFISDVCDSLTYYVKGDKYFFDNNTGAISSTSTINHAMADYSSYGCLLKRPDEELPFYFDEGGKYLTVKSRIRNSRTEYFRGNKNVFQFIASSKKVKTKDIFEFICSR